MRRPISGSTLSVLLIVAIVYACATAPAVGSPPPPAPPPRGGGPPPPAATPAPVATPQPAAAPGPAQPGAPAPPAGDPAKANAGTDNKGLDVPSLEPEPVERAKSAKTAKKTERDPVAAAFAVDHASQLTDKQAEAIKKFREKMEPELKTAFKKMDEAAAGIDKVAASRKVRDLVKEIRNKIQDIVDPPTDTTTNPPATQYPRSYYQNQQQYQQQYRQPGYQPYNYNRYR
jgi:hypothetical protein